MFSVWCPLSVILFIRKWLWSAASSLITTNTETHLNTYSTSHIHSDLITFETKSCTKCDQIQNHSLQVLFKTGLYFTGMSFLFFIDFSLPFANVSGVDVIRINFCGSRGNTGSTKQVDNCLFWKWFQITERYPGNAELAL